MGHQYCGQERGMILDLREILDKPGYSIPFQYELELEDPEFESARVEGPVSVYGTVRNVAGVMLLNADFSARLSCVCDRCAAQFEKELKRSIEVCLADDLQDDEDPDYYPIEGNCCNVDDIITTELVLGMDTRFLCREDCKGLCPGCGADLNKGPCSCKKETDPRLAVLEQLLEG